MLFCFSSFFPYNGQSVFFVKSVRKGLCYKSAMPPPLSDFPERVTEEDEVTGTEKLTSYSTPPCHYLRP